MRPYPYCWSRPVAPRSVANCSMAASMAAGAASAAPQIPIREAQTSKCPAETDTRRCRTGEGRNARPRSRRCRRTRSRRSAAECPLSFRQCAGSRRARPVQRTGRSTSSRHAAGRGRLRRRPRLPVSSSHSRLAIPSDFPARSRSPPRWKQTRRGSLRKSPPPAIRDSAVQTGRCSG